MIKIAKVLQFIFALSFISPVLACKRPIDQQEDARKPQHIFVQLPSEVTEQILCVSNDFYALKTIRNLKLTDKFFRDFINQRKALFKEFSIDLPGQVPYLDNWLIKEKVQDDLILKFLFKTCPHLTNLTFVSSVSTNNLASIRTTDVLAEFTSLESLDYTYNRYGVLHRVITPFSVLIRLKSLILVRDDIRAEDKSNDELSAFTTLTNLVEFKMKGFDIHTGVKHLSTRLQILDVGDSPCFNFGMPFLSLFPDLTYLNLENTGLHFGNELSVLACLSNLKRLSLAHKESMDASEEDEQGGIKHLSKLTTLEFLNLKSPNGTDGWHPKEIRCLSALPFLQVFWGTNVPYYNNYDSKFETHEFICKYEGWDAMRENREPHTFPYSLEEKHDEENALEEMRDYYRDAVPKWKKLLADFEF